MLSISSSANVDALNKAIFKASHVNAFLVYSKEEYNTFTLLSYPLHREHCDDLIQTLKILLRPGRDVSSLEFSSVPALDDKFRVAIKCDLASETQKWNQRLLGNTMPGMTFKEIIKQLNGQVETDNCYPNNILICNNDSKSALESIIQARGIAIEFYQFEQAMIYTKDEDSMKEEIFETYEEQQTPFEKTSAVLDGISKLLCNRFIFGQKDYRDVNRLIIDRIADDVGLRGEFFQGVMERDGVSFADYITLAIHHFLTGLEEDNPMINRDEYIDFIASMNLKAEIARIPETYARLKEIAS